MGLGVVYFRFTQRLGRPDYVWDECEMMMMMIMKGKEKVKPGADSKHSLLKKHQGLTSPSDVRIAINSTLCLLNIRIYCGRVWNLFQAFDVQSIDYKVYISTPLSPEDRTTDPLNQRQICYHLSQRGAQKWKFVFKLLFIQPLITIRIFHCKPRTKAAFLPKGRSSTANSGTKVAVLPRMNSCGSSQCFPHPTLSLSSKQTLKDLKYPTGPNVEVRRVDLANWALRTSPKFTTGVKYSYQFHKCFGPDQRSGNPNYPSPPSALI